LQPDDLEDARTELTATGSTTPLRPSVWPRRCAWPGQRATGGTACIVGAGREDDKLVFSAFEVFFNEKTLVGSYYGSSDVRSDFHRFLRLWKAGQLDSKA